MSDTHATPPARRTATSPPPAPKKAKYPTGRRWMLTIFDEEFISSWTRLNNYYDYLQKHTADGQDLPELTNDDKRWMLDVDEKVTYMMGQVERTPSTKKEHVQVFIIMKTPCRLTGIKKMFKVNDLHAELAKEASAACSKYCSKTDTRVVGPYEYGSLPDKQGELNEEAANQRVLVIGTQPFVIVPLRTWDDMCEMLRDGLSNDAEMEDALSDCDSVVDLTRD